MTVRYLQLQPGSEPPQLSKFSPFKCVIVSDEEASDEWMWLVSTWLVKSGCLWMNAWGENCRKWEDSVDYADLEISNWVHNPDNDVVMTTSWVNKLLDDVFGFTKSSPSPPLAEVENTLILHISDLDMESDLLGKYNSAQAVR